MAGTGTGESRRAGLRREAGEAFFEAEAERIAQLCHAMSERFAAGGRLIAAGSSPAGRSDARHVAVEFVHPVIVGKRALPAIGLAAEGGPLAAQIALTVEPGDIFMPFDPGLEAPGDGADDLVRSARRDDPFIRQEIVETSYHLLWELVHVFFEHRASAGDTGASSFLYPFLNEGETDVGAVLADVAASVRMKSAEVAELREQTLREGADALMVAAEVLRERFEAGGRLLVLGNGGSATDAMDVAADFRHPPRGEWLPRPVLDLTEDAAILTALANDIGVEGGVLPAGDRARAARRRAAGDLHQRRLGQRARRAGRGAPARHGHDRAGRLRRRRDRGRRARRPRRRHPLPAHPADPGGPGERLPRAAGARRVRAAPRARVEGVVQGVGFRPFVHRLAGELALDGFVLNDERGVLVEVQGSPERVERFLARLRTDAPPLAIVERVLAEPVEPSPERGFRIVESTGGGRADALVSADVATCEDCLAELFDPADRRHRYPFLNCTNCGPRFTIVRGVPYDRANTTMARFAMCDALPRGVRRPGRPPLPRPADRVPYLRTRSFIPPT